MERRVYDQMRHFEESWWYEGRKNVIERVCSRFVQYKHGDALDIGAGWGGMFQSLCSSAKVIDAIETDDIARAKLVKRGYRKVFSSEREIRAHYDLVAAFDVLEHIEDDAAALRKWKELLHEGGVVVLTVPAHQFLYTSHDRVCHHYRRYGKKELTDLFVNAGLVPLYVSYWNAPSFFPAVLLRLVNAKGDRNEFLAEGFVSRMLRALLRVETRLIPDRAIPFGTSLIIVGQKYASSQSAQS